MEVEDLDTAIKKFRDDTGHGVDALGPTNLSRLPTPAKRELLGTLHAAEEAWTWPWQMLANIIYLKRKPPPSAEDRALALIPFIVRMWGVRAQGGDGPLVREEGPTLG